MDKLDCSQREKKFGYCMMDGNYNQKRCGHYPDCPMKKHE